MKTTVADLYRGELNVWVEDHLTHAVLTDVWADPRINVLVAAGKEGVRHMVKAAAPRHAAVVYGLLDRDFDEDDEARWEQPERRLLHFPAPEFENLLLDFDLLAELSGSRSADEIRACAKERAQRLLWWMSCKAVLHAPLVFAEDPVAISTYPSGFCGGPCSYLYIPLWFLRRTL